MRNSLPGITFKDTKKIVNFVALMDLDEKFMRDALMEAEAALADGEVPVGAVIVSKGRIIAKGHNMTDRLHDPTAHAEMIAIREAARTLGGWRLLGCDIYVTVEPCSMCAGAMVLARIARLVIGTDDPKTGACGSLYNIASDERLNHSIEITRGVLAEECSAILKDFFRSRR